MWGVALLVSLGVSPEVMLTDVDTAGCGRVMRQVGTALATLRGGPAGLCVTEALALTLEPDARHVALLVRAPHRFDARVRTRVFVYVLDGEVLVPRFLSSGFVARDVVGLRRGGAPEELGVLTRGPKGDQALACRFVGFPLVCAPMPNASDRSLTAEAQP